VLNVIKEYLVSLGFAVDTTSYNSARRSVDEMGRVVDRFADSSAVKFAATGAAITGFVTAAVAALHQFTIGVAQADLQNEIFARQMWMSKDAAVSYQKSLDALGVSLQDLYLSPELMGKFIELRKQAQVMEAPGGFDEAMRGIRDITFEYQRFKLEASYAVYWVGYYMTKYLAGPLGDTRDWLKNINDTITSKMPYWTKNVAQVLSWFARLGNAAYLAGKEIKDIWDSLGGSTKEVIGITAGFFALLRMGPLGWVIAGLTTLLLLIDDFATYERGGESAFPKLWEWVDKLKESMNDTGTTKKFLDSINELSTSVLDLGNSLGDLLESFGILKDGDYTSAVVFAIDQIAIAFKGLALIIEASAAGWEEIAGLINKDPKQIEAGKKRGSRVWNQILGIEDESSSNDVSAEDPSALLHKQLESKIDQQREDLQNVPHNAAGTNNWRGGETWVGERGPELVNLPRGSQVASNETLGAAVTAMNRLTGSLGQLIDYVRSPGVAQKDNIVNVSFQNGEKKTDAEKTNYGSFVKLMQGMASGFQRWSEGFKQSSNANQVSQGSPFDYFSMASLMRSQHQSVVTNVSVSPNYNIYGATNPQGVVTVIDRTNTNLLIRSLQGVEV